MIRLTISSAGSRRRSSVPLTKPIWSFLTRSAILANSSGQSIAGVGAAQVLEGELGHPGEPRPALLDVADLDVGDHAAQDDLGLFGQRRPARRRGGSPGPGASRRGGSEGGSTCRSPSAFFSSASRSASGSSGRSGRCVRRGRRGRCRSTWPLAVSVDDRGVEEAELAAPAVLLLGLAGLERPGQDGQELADACAPRQSKAPALISVSTQPGRRPWARPARRSRRGCGTGPSARAP